MGDTLPLKMDPPPRKDAEINTNNIIKTITDNTTDTTDKDYHSIVRSEEDFGENEREKERERYRELILGNIGYSDLVLRHPGNKRVIDRILKIMTETVCSKDSHVFIAKKNRSIADIKSRYLTLRQEHIEHVLHNLPEDDSGVALKDRFLMAYLYNAIDTIDQI